MDMIGAGVDTTSAALSFTLYNLAKHPDKQEILRQEILKILPTKDSVLDVKSLDNVPYLRAVIKESFRIYPVTNGNLRRLKQDVVLQGYQIPKGVSNFARAEHLN
jgi:cytochrome P450 family 12